MRGIIVAFNDQQGMQKIVDVLEKNNFFVKETASNASMALRRISSGDGGGLVICGGKFSDMTAMQLFSLLPEDYDMLVLSSDTAGLELSYGLPDGLFTLALPLHSQDLLSSVRMLLDTRQMYRDTSKKGMKKTGGTSSPEWSEQERKQIEEAKTLLIMRNNMSEPEAHRFLQKRSMELGIKIQDTAKIVLEGRMIDS